VSPKERTDTLDHGGVSLHLTLYEADPQAPSLIFLHGMTGHAGLYAETIPGANYLVALAAEGFNTGWFGECLR
jgi:alpha-beta hydrolase superfamily lysophospholipase